MIKLSEMYRISGGCIVGRMCSECANCISTKDLTCIVYPKEYGKTWSSSRIACKYFRERVISDQIDMTDWMKEMIK